MGIKNIFKFLISISFLIILFIHEIIDNKKILDLRKSEFSKENIYDISSSVGEVLLATVAYKIFVYNAVTPLNMFAYNSIFIGGSLIVEGLKHYIHEERPDKSNFHGFPSGHSFVSTLSLLFIFFSNIKRKFSIRLSTENIVICVIAVLTCCFRVLALKHFLHDILAGLLIGLFSFILGMPIARYFYEKFFGKIFKRLGFSV